MDLMSANAARLEGVPDLAVLALAANQQRILVSHDFHTTPRHFADFVQTYGAIPGVFPIRQYLPIRDAFDELVLIRSASNAEEWASRILRIPLA
jgi:hypothetical protein